jgi:hypothetical protein
MSGEIDEETADETVDALSSAGEDVSEEQRNFAGIALAILYFGAGAALIAAFYFDVINASLNILAEANVGWVVEYFIAFMFASFCAFVIGLHLKWMESSVINAIGAIGLGIADYLGMIDDEE